MQTTASSSYLTSGIRQNPQGCVTPSAASWDSVDLKTHYLFLDRSGKLHAEQKGATSWFGRWIRSLFGARDYRLEHVLQRVLKPRLSSLSQHEKEEDPLYVLAAKTFRSMRFNLKEAGYLTELLTCERVRINVRSDDPDLRPFNQKLTRCMQRLEALFGEVARKNMLHSLRTITYKAPIIRALLDSRPDESTSFSGKLHTGATCWTPHELVQIDRIDAFRNKFLAERKDDAVRISLDLDDPVREFAKKAAKERIRLLNLISEHPADVLFFDSPTIKSVGVWHCDILSPIYLALKGLQLSHAAVEYHVEKPCISHLLGEYENNEVHLQHTVFQRYRLKLSELLTPEAKEVLSEKMPENLEQTLHKSFGWATLSHLSEHDDELQSVVNPGTDRLLFPFEVHAFKKSVDQSQARPYPSRMLCSEYVQISLVNRLLQLGKQLQAEHGLKEPAIKIPLGPRDFDRVSPPDLFRRWSPYLEKVPNLLELMWKPQQAPHTPPLFPQG